jgi:hypothetical protein
MSRDPQQVLHLSRMVSPQSQSYLVCNIMFLFFQDEEAFPTSDPSSLSPGNHRLQGSLSAFVYSLQRNTYDYSTLREEEEEGETDELQEDDLGNTVLNYTKPKSSDLEKDHAEKDAGDEVEIDHSISKILTPASHSTSASRTPLAHHFSTPPESPPLEFPDSEPEFPVLSSHDTPLAEELFGCMDNGLPLDPLDILDGGDDGEIGGRSQSNPITGQDGLGEASVAAGTGEHISDSPVPDSDEELSVSALIMEAFTSLPELDEGVVEINGRNGTKDRRRSKDEVPSAESGTGRCLRELSPEIPLPRSTSRPSMAKSERGKRKSLSSGISHLSKLSGSRPQSAVQKATVLFEGVDGPVFDSDSEVGLDQLVPSPSLAPMARTPTHAHVNLSIPDKPGLPKASKLDSKSVALARGASTTPTVNPPAMPKPSYISSTYVSLRSPSPISSLTSSDDESVRVMGNSDDSDVMVVPVKRKKKKKVVKPDFSSPIVVNKRVQSQLPSKSKVDLGLEQPVRSSAASSGSRSVPQSQEPEVPEHRKNFLQLKLKAPDGQSMAVTRVKRKRIDRLEKMREWESEIEAKNRIGRKPNVKLKQRESEVAPQQSVAATRVKKRKVNERELDMEPPLKRAKRQSMSTSTSSTGVGGGPSSKAKGKAKEKDMSVSPKKKGRLSKVNGIQWPAKIKTGVGRRKVTCALLHFALADW